MNKKLRHKDHFHFIGIGGIGMSAIAMALIKKGYSVSGSDLIQNKETKSLKTLEWVPLWLSFVRGNVDAPPWTVWGKHLTGKGQHFRLETFKS